MIKRGLSEIIVVVLIVLLTLAAAGILISFVVPFVNNSLEEGTECFDYQNYFSFESENGLNCFVRDPEPGERNYYLSIRAKTINQENKIEGMKILFKSGDNVRVFDVKNNAPTGSGEGALNMIPNALAFSLPDEGEVKNYFYDDLAEDASYEVVEVYPVLDRNRLCEKSDEIVIQACSTEIENAINQAGGFG